MGMSDGPVCAQCNIGMMLDRIEPHARRDRVLIEVYRCAQCQLVERIMRPATLRLDGDRATPQARPLRQLRA